MKSAAGTEQQEHRVKQQMCSALNDRSIVPFANLASTIERHIPVITALPIIISCATPSKIGVMIQELEMFVHSKKMHCISSTEHTIVVNKVKHLSHFFF